MNINKKFDRIKQWTNEKMGAEAKTGVSDEFKALEMEMTLRHEGMSSMTACPTLLTSARNGEAPEIHDNLCQVAFKTRRD